MTPASSGSFEPQEPVCFGCGQETMCCDCDGAKTIHLVSKQQYDALHNPKR